MRAASWISNVKLLTIADHPSLDGLWVGTEAAPVVVGATVRNDLHTAETQASDASNGAILFRETVTGV